MYQNTMPEALMEAADQFRTGGIASIKSDEHEDMDKAEFVHLTSQGDSDRFGAIGGVMLTLDACHNI